VKFDQEDTNGIVYLWVGSKTDPEDIKLAEEIADDMFNDVNFAKKKSINIRNRPVFIISILAPVLFIIN